MATNAFDVNNNEQHIVSRRFHELRLVQKQKKDTLRLFLLNELAHLLPEELWDIILLMVFTDEDQIAYFGFKRKDTIYNDDHYIFEGTEKDWPLAIEQMRSVVNPYDEQDDIPTDTYCSGSCEYMSVRDGLPVSCPDEFGNRCECRWAHQVFNTHYTFTNYRIMCEHIVIKTRLSENGYLWNLSSKSH